MSGEIVICCSRGIDFEVLLARSKLRLDQAHPGDALARFVAFDLLATQGIHIAGQSIHATKVE